MSKRTIKKIMLILCIASIIACFKLFRLDHYLTLTYIKASQETFSLYYIEHRFLVISCYMFLYILVTSLSLPGAAVMSLAGGALFGLLTGTVIVSFASTIGATLACAASRFLLRDWVQSRFSDKLATVSRGIEQEGTFYLFTLRLIPVFPFFIINLVMGLTSMRLLTFYWISQLGMLPGTLVYVNAGRELARIDSLSGILSPGLLLSFLILGLFPLVTKRVLSFYKSRSTHYKKHS